MPFHSVDDYTKKDQRGNRSKDTLIRLKQSQFTDREPAWKAEGKENKDLLYLEREREKIWQEDHEMNLNEKWRGRAKARIPRNIPMVFHTSPPPPKKKHGNSTRVKCCIYCNTKFCNLLCKKEEIQQIKVNIKKNKDDFADI